MPLNHTSLLEDIDRTIPDEGELVFWWLGQHSYVLKLGATVIYLDPFLSPMEARLVAPPLSADEIHHAALILGKNLIESPEISIIQ